MKEKQINAAIAEACGRHAEPKPIGSFYVTALWHHNNYKRPLNVMPVPDYCNDLNAMHEAESSIPHPSYFYQFNLTEVCGGENRIYRATASQRAEAFLRTLGKWEEA